MFTSPYRVCALLLKLNIISIPITRSGHEVNDVRQTEIHTGEPLVPDPSTFEVELAIGKLKSHKSTGSNQIPAELIKADCTRKGQNLCITVVIYSDGNSTLFLCARLAPCYSFGTVLTDAFIR